jgi:hypothetical protein
MGKSAAASEPQPGIGNQTCTTPLLAAESQKDRDGPDAEMARRVNLKLDLGLLPLLSLLYLFNGLDRGNIGNAQTQGDSTHVRVMELC